MQCPCFCSCVFIVGTNRFFVSANRFFVGANKFYTRANSPTGVRQVSDRLSDRLSDRHNKTLYFPVRGAQGAATLGKYLQLASDRSNIPYYCKQFVSDRFPKSVRQKSDTIRQESDTSVRWQFSETRWRVLETRWRVLETRW